MARFRLLSVLLTATVLLSAAAASHHGTPASTPAHDHHSHRSPTSAATPTAPPMHQDQLESKESQSLLALDPSTAAAQAPSGEEAMAHRALLVPPQAPSPPPSFAAAAGLASRAPPHPQAGTAWSASAAAAPGVNEAPPETRNTLHPNLYRAAVASPRLRVHAGDKGFVASGVEQGLLQLERALTSLGYNEMASAAELLADSPSLTVERWRGPITVFAAPDTSVQGSCPGCPRRHLLLAHMALGYFPYSELAAAPTVKLPSAADGFCLHVAYGLRPALDIHRVSLYVAGVEVSRPELYNDGRYVVHGLHGFVPPLSHTSCYEGSHHHLAAARSAAPSAAPAALVGRIMIRDAISRLRDGGFGIVSQAMIINFAELEKFEDLTVFALDDQAISTGESGGDYISAVRFHIVPGHRLTRADLLRLRPGTMLPTLAGDDQKLVITHDASSGSDEVLINYMPVKDPDVVVNSRVAIHGIHVQFPRLHPDYLADLVADADTDAIPSVTGDLLVATSVGAALGAALGTALGHVLPMDHLISREEDGLCSQCGTRPIDWTLTCCGRGVCAPCLPIISVNSHTNSKGRTCRRRGDIVPVLDSALYAIHGMLPFPRPTLQQPWFHIHHHWVNGFLLECTFASLDDCRRGGPVIRKKKLLYLSTSGRLVRACEIDLSGFCCLY